MISSPILPRPGDVLDRLDQEDDVEARSAVRQLPAAREGVADRQPRRAGHVAQNGIAPDVEGRDAVVGAIGEGERHSAVAGAEIEDLERPGRQAADDRTRSNGAARRRGRIDRGRIEAVPAGTAGAHRATARADASTHSEKTRLSSDQGRRTRNPGKAGRKGLPPASGTGPGSVTARSLSVRPRFSAATSSRRPSRSFASASRTAGVFPGEERMTTQPPPPAPHAFAPQAPASRAAPTTPSIPGDDTTGASRRRASHSRLSAAPIARKSSASTASAISRAAARTSSRRAATPRSPSSRDRKISQLFMPDECEAPVSKRVRCCSHSEGSRSRRSASMRPGKNRRLCSPPESGG